MLNEVGQAADATNLSPRLETKPEPEDQVYEYLERTGFLEMSQNKERLEEWLKQQEVTELKDYIVRLNGIIRGIPTSQRTMDGATVRIETTGFAGIEMGTDYLPPLPEDRDALLDEALQAVQSIDDPQDQALVIYLSLQAIHPFLDGNGRTGRLLYTLLRNAGAEHNSLEAELKQLSHHDGESGAGRKDFEKQVRPPKQIYSFVMWNMGRRILGKELFRASDEHPRVKRAYCFADDGFWEQARQSSKLPEQQFQHFQAIFEESQDSAMSPGSLTLLSYLKDTNRLDQFCEVSASGVYSVDLERFIQQATEDDVNEIVRRHGQIKAMMVRYLIDMSAHPDKYPMKGWKDISGWMRNQPEEVVAQ